MEHLFSLYFLWFVLEPLFHFNKAQHKETEVEPPCAMRLQQETFLEACVGRDHTFQMTAGWILARQRECNRGTYDVMRP